MTTPSLNDILAIARKEVVKSHDAYLFNGTLFCLCTEQQARRIQTAIEESGDISTLISPVGEEWAFDFVVDNI